MKKNTDNIEQHYTIIRHDPFFWHFSFIYLISLTPNTDLSVRLFPGRELRRVRKRLSEVGGIFGRHGPSVVKPTPAPPALPAAQSLDLGCLVWVFFFFSQEKTASHFGRMLARLRCPTAGKDCRHPGEEVAAERRRVRNDFHVSVSKYLGFILEPLQILCCIHRSARGILLLSWHYLWQR